MQTSAEMFTKYYFTCNLSCKAKGLFWLAAGTLITVEWLPISPHTCYRNYLGQEVNIKQEMIFHILSPAVTHFQSKNSTHLWLQLYLLEASVSSYPTKPVEWIGRSWMWVEDCAEEDFCSIHLLSCAPAHLHHAWAWCHDGEVSPAQRRGPQELYLCRSQPTGSLCQRYRTEASASLHTALVTSLNFVICFCEQRQKILI